MYVSCHRPFIPGTSLEPAVIPTAQASSFTLQYFWYYVWCSKYSSIIIIIIIIIIMLFAQSEVAEKHASGTIFFFSRTARMGGVIAPTL